MKAEGDPRQTVGSRTLSAALDPRHAPWIPRVIDAAAERLRQPTRSRHVRTNLSSTLRTWDRTEVFSAMGCRGRRWTAECPETRPFEERCYVKSGSAAEAAP